MRHKDLLDRYLASVGVTWTPSTVSAHKGKLQPLLKAWDHLDTKEFTAHLFVAYVLAEKAGGWKPRTQQMLIDYARTFIRWCAENAIPFPDFVGSMKKPRVHLGKVVFYTEEELARLLEGAKNDRLAVVVVAGAFLGCRKTEIWNLMWEDISWEERVVTIHGTKTGRDREVPMSETCYRVLRSCWRNQKSGRLMESYQGPATQWFSINVWRDLTRLCKRVVVPAPR